MTSRIAYGAIGWNRPLCEVLAVLETTGVSGLEAYGLTEMLPTDGEFPRRISQSSVELAGSYFASSFVQPDYFEREDRDFRATAEEVIALGGERVIVGGGRMLKGAERETLWKTFVGRIRQIHRIAESIGVKMSFHPHCGTLVFTEDEILRFVSECPTVAICLDTAHVALGGSPLVELANRIVHRCDHVHLKDLDEDGHFVELGRGRLPIPEVIEVLKANSYSGWLTVELDASRDPEQSARRNVDYMHEFTL